MRRISRSSYRLFVLTLTNRQKAEPVSKVQWQVANDKWPVISSRLDRSGSSGQYWKIFMNARARRVKPLRGPGLRSSLNMPRPWMDWKSGTRSWFLPGCTWVTVRYWRSIQGEIGKNPIKGVFATRSPHRPNPIGLHKTRITAVEPPSRIKVKSLEVIDNTPVVDIKSVVFNRLFQTSLSDWVPFCFRDLELPTHRNSLGQLFKDYLARYEEGRKKCPI